MSASTLAIARVSRMQHLAAVRAHPLILHACLCWPSGHHGLRGHAMVSVWGRATPTNQQASAGMHSTRTSWLHCTHEAHPSLHRQQQTAAATASQSKGQTATVSAGKVRQQPCPLGRSDSYRTLQMSAQTAAQLQMTEQPFANQSTNKQTNLRCLTCSRARRDARRSMHEQPDRRANGHTCNQTGGPADTRATRQELAQRQAQQPRDRPLCHGSC